MKEILNNYNWAYFWKDFYSFKQGCAMVSCDIIDDIVDEHGEPFYFKIMNKNEINDICVNIGKPVPCEKSCYNYTVYSGDTGKQYNDLKELEEDLIILLLAGI